MPYEMSSPSMREHVSFSQLALVARCGEAYRRNYVVGDNPDRPLNVPALAGGAFHSAVEEMEQTETSRLYELSLWGEHEGLERDLALLMKLKIREMMDYLEIKSEDLLYYGKQDLPFYFRKKIPEWSHNYLTYRAHEISSGYQWHHADPGESLEVNCLVELDGIGKFTGFIDQLLTDSLGRTIIRDLKTGKPKASDAMQLEQYRFALAHSHGIEADYGQIMYVSGGETTIHTVRWSLSDVDIIQMIYRLNEAIGTNIFQVNGPYNGACSSCDFHGDCPWGKVAVHSTA